MYYVLSSKSLLAGLGDWSPGAVVPWYRGAVPVVLEDSHSHQQTRPSSAVTATLSVTRQQTPDTLPVMSEDHFDQYEYYNFEEKLLSSRNTGTFTFTNCQGVEQSTWVLRSNSPQLMATNIHRVSCHVGRGGEAGAWLESDKYFM